MMNSEVRIIPARGLISSRNLFWIWKSERGRFL